MGDTDTTPGPVLTRRDSVLVISRKLGERVFVGEDIVVTVVDIDRGKIRLGISAPKGTPIAREELLGDDEKRRVEEAARK